MAQGTTGLARLAIVRARWRFMSSSKLPAVCPVYTASGSHAASVPSPWLLLSAAKPAKEKCMLMGDPLYMTAMRSISAALGLSWELVIRTMPKNCSTLSACGAQGQGRFYHCALASFLCSCCASACMRMCVLYVPLRPAPHHTRVVEPGYKASIVSSRS